MRRFFKGLVALTIVAAGFLGGFSPEVIRSVREDRSRTQAGVEMVAAKLGLLLRGLPARAQGDAASLGPVDTYFSVLDTIRSDFYSPQRQATPSARKLTYAAIRGMLRTLNDPYTSFWTPDEYRKQMEETRGDFVGIGAVLDMTKDKKVLIVEPIEHSPAIRKGILPGDIIVKVDNKPIVGLELTDVVTRIRGEQGTPVTLSILRKGQAKLRDITIVRQPVQSPMVKYRMVDRAAGIGYIQLSGFNERADEQFAEAITALKKQGMRALVFDLRNNPGGLLNVAQDIASRFIEKGPLVWIQEKNGTKISLNVKSDKHQSWVEVGEYPVAVLINGYSASASEIVAGAIRDYGVGTLVGTTTYGKGLVQTIIPLADDSAVKVTTQHYFTPKMGDINKKFDDSGKQISGGIKPDVVVEITDKDAKALQEATLNAAPEEVYQIRNDPRYDPQLRKALEVIREKMTGRNNPAPPVQTTQQ